MDNLKKIAVGASALVVTFTLCFAILAWSEPGNTPPDGNVAAPVNTSVNDQIKAGGLGFGSTVVADNNAPYYVEETGGTLNFIPGQISNPPSLTIGQNGAVSVGSEANPGKLCLSGVCCSKWEDANCFGAQ